MMLGLAPLLVCFAPLGPHDVAMMRASARGVEAVFAARTRILAPGPLPPRAFTAPRRRWRAELLLEHLQDAVHPGSGCDVVVGVTSEDISTTVPGRSPDWGVLGLAWLATFRAPGAPARDADDPGPVAVVSSFRARRGVARRKATQRVVKVILHELGHVLGADHIDEPGCLMRDAGGKVRTVDDEPGTLCATERAIFERALGPLPRLDRLDWDGILRARGP